MNREWWHGAVAYQVYPKSFMDSNGDGIGDLRGLISKLDYLRDLGIDIIWLSPAYPSPLADEGYDVSDYYGVDPRFGTLADMDELIAECGKRNMKLILDLVANHCSDEHMWFQDVLRNPDSSPYRDYFYIEDKRADGNPPTNWRSYFGGGCWSPLGDSGKVYLHLFHKKQPDLNWENPAVREEIIKNIKWWLQRGVAGFRIDAIINIKKALPFRDYPADAPDGLSGLDNMLEEAKGIGVFLTELRERAFEGCFTVGEVFNVEKEHADEWIGLNGYFSTMFDFSGTIFGSADSWWHNKVKITAEDYKKCVFAAQEAAGSNFISNIIENHDEARGVNYYLPEGEITDAGKKMLAGLYFLLRGIPFIYQGQELGMENTVINSIDGVDDCATFHQYRAARDSGLSEEEAMQAIRRFSRDNARTPVQWDATANAGFTTGKPWLPVNPNYISINAAAQADDNCSVLAFYKRLISLRKNKQYQDTIVYGSFEPYLPEQKNLFAYKRLRLGGLGEQILLIAGNFQNKPQKMSLPSAIRKVVMNNYNDVYISENSLTLEPYQFVALEII